jgi:hypothetical protein
VRSGAYNRRVSQYQNEATFYRAALLLGLVRGEDVLQWSDAVLSRDADAPAEFVEISSSPPADLTALRHALYPLCHARETAEVVRAILARVGTDLSSGRRSLADTMTVLSQVRRFLTVSPEMNDQLKALGVSFFVARTGESAADREAHEAGLREWLAQFASDPALR